MPQVYLFATLSGNHQIIDCRYLHATRESREEAEELCEDLNDHLADSQFRVVDE